MIDLTRCDSLMRAHNGRLCHQCATLLADQVELSHSLSFSFEGGKYEVFAIKTLLGTHEISPLNLSLGLVSS